MSPVHPLVRDLYKRVIHAGRDYPTGLPHVREVWKKAMRSPDNCPSCYENSTVSETTGSFTYSKECEHEIKLAVGRGRKMVREMIAISQLKKYRAMKARYGESNSSDEERLENTMNSIEDEMKRWR